MLSHVCMRERHWEKIVELVGKEIPYNSETLTYEELLTDDLLSANEGIERIHDFALKEHQIEKVLNTMECIYSPAMLLIDRDI